jgi:hypothetical protein
MDALSTLKRAEQRRIRCETAAPSVERFRGYLTRFLGAIKIEHNVH